MIVITNGKIKTNMSLQDNQAEANEHADEIERYKKCLKEIKQRLFVLQQRLNQGSNDNDKVIDTEIICLQFRSIVELILLSSLAAHKKMYTKSLDDIKEMWRIKPLISILKNANPNFYPVPVNIPLDNIKKGEVLNMTIIETGYLTLEDATELYNDCSDYLHPRNPFADNIDYKVWLKFQEWFDKIGRLLYHHVINMFESGKGILGHINFDDPKNKEEVFAMYLKVEGRQVH